MRNNIDKARKLVGQLRGNLQSSSSHSKSKGRLGKAVSSVKQAIDLRKAQTESPFDLQKGVHDAMMHHAAHASAAMRACWGQGVDNEKCKAAAKKHTFMFLRHALENSRSRMDPWAMKEAIRRAIEYYDAESGYDNEAEFEHYKGNGQYVPAPEDSDFEEDYEGSKAGPDPKKTGAKI